MSHQVTITTSKPVVILLDTNLLLVPTTYAIDIFSATHDVVIAPTISFCTLDKTIEELTYLSTGNSATARGAKLALHLLKKQNVSIIITTKTEEISSKSIKHLTKQTKQTSQKNNKNTSKEFKNPFSKQVSTSARYADNAIVEYAKAFDQSKSMIIVGTNDKELKNRLIIEKIPILYTAGLKKLAARIP